MREKLLKDGLLTLLRQASYPGGVLPSGGKGRPYIDFGGAMAGIDCLQTSAHLLYQIIKKHSVCLDAVGGPAMGAISLAYVVATASYTSNSPLTPFYVRKQPKGGEWVAGSACLRPNMRAAVIDDVIRSGTSITKAVGRALDIGLIVPFVAALVDFRDDPTADLCGLPCYSLFTASDFT